MIDNSGGTDSVGDLSRLGGNLQHLPESAQRLAGYFCGVIAAGISNHHDPHGMVPT
jgi:hypothetical protein